MAVPSVTLRRCISTSSICHGARNFRKFDLYNKRGSRAFKQRPNIHKDEDMPIQKRGCRDVGYMKGDKFVFVPEMVPELIVPDLTGFKLKPYVCYNTGDFTQRAFTAKDLFDAFYAPKIMEDFKENKLNAEGDPLEPSEFEQLTPEKALENARKTGCDMFTQPPPSRKEQLEKYSQQNRDYVEKIRKSCESKHINDLDK